VTYPFLPAIARGLGISFEKAGILVAVRHFVGLTGAIWGLLGERKGYAWGMVLGLFALFIGSLTIAVSRTFPLALLGFVIIGLSKPVYDPNVQAFASSRIPYSKRAWALGILESSWAGSWLIGIPLSGLLIAHFGWQSPFVLISAAALLAIICTKNLQQVTGASPNYRKSASQVVMSTREEVTVRARPILILGVSLLMVFANENMVIVYGAWLEKHFNLQVQTLGLYSILVGLAELAGEFTVVFLVDRFGKRRAILTGLLLTGMSYLALPFCQSSIVLAFLGLVVMFYLFEFTIVSIFPYVSELVPSERGKWFAFNFSALVVGRMSGALLGPWLWERSADLYILSSYSLPAQVAAVILLLLSSNRKAQSA
jgi:predicted MFS family arabinose efflux permease